MNNGLCAVLLILIQRRSLLYTWKIMIVVMCNNWRAACTC
ncbi:hypothetical protein VD0004_g2549 [Verticillium dahliae]|nr:hypothetical protein VD0004_g2549 [Verticillium dahliae]PNH74059.1 hypothetical protein VD0001_g3476 [Verticillium dahliae]